MLRAGGRAIERAAAPITDGSTVVADTARAVATCQRHASIEARLYVQTAGGILNLRRVRGAIRHSGINYSRIGNARIGGRVRARAGVCARILAAVRSSFELNHACVGKASIDLRVRARVGVCDRILLAHHAGFKISGDRVGCGSPSAGARRAAAHVGGDRIENRHGGI